MTSLHAPPPSISLFGFNLSHHSRLTQFLLTSTAVLTFHVAQGYIQVREKIRFSLLRQCIDFAFGKGINSSIKTVTSISKLFYVSSIRLFYDFSVWRTIIIRTID